VIAANVDYLFLVNALNHDFNVRRIERYLLLAYESGAMPVIVLTKSSLCEDVEQKIVETEAVAIGVPIFVVDSLEHTGIESLQQFVTSGKTIALVGSSGVGKSTLLNILSTIDIPTTGEIIVNGKNIIKMKDEQLTTFRSDTLGFIFQDYNLLDTLTIKDNILLPLALRNINAHEIDARV
ncbi:GTPase RsgA, partial [Bacillus cereus]|nr:GTPase RsgA [Bacillus cereus]